MLPLSLGLGVAGLLGLAAGAASLSGSPLSPGAPELSDLPSAIFFAAAAAAFVLYALALYLVRRRRAAVLTVCAVAAAVQLVPLAGPLILSRDVYARWAYGRVTADHHANPYVVAPAHYAADPATRAMARGWRGADTVYGPAFSAASAGLATTTGRSAETTALLYPRSRPRSSVGTRSSHWTSPAADTTTSGWPCSCSARPFSPAGGPPSRARAGRSRPG
jgi:hypothetical protein